MPTKSKRQHNERRRPGQIRDAIVSVLSNKPKGASVFEIQDAVHGLIGSAAPSSIRSYLRLNSDSLFRRQDRGIYTICEAPAEAYGRKAKTQLSFKSYTFGATTLFEGDCFEWLRQQPDNTIHAVVTDPPYGLVECAPEQQEKLRNGKGGIWRIPPAFDGTKRSPLPRFTVLSRDEAEELARFFCAGPCVATRSCSGSQRRYCKQSFAFLRCVGSPSTCRVGTAGRNRTARYDDARRRQAETCT